MIFWCRGCGDQLVTNNPDVDLMVEADFDCGCWLDKRLAEAIRRPIDVETLLGPYHAPEYFTPEPRPDPVERAYISLSKVFDDLEKLWEKRTPRIEYNTVDLKQLREEREPLWRKLGRYNPIFPV